jgi:hypothetical protein
VVTRISFVLQWVKIYRLHAIYIPALICLFVTARDVSVGSEERELLQLTHAQHIYETLEKSTAFYPLRVTSSLMHEHLERAYIRRVVVDIADEGSDSHLPIEVRSKYPKYKNGSVIVYVIVCYEIYIDLALNEEAAAGTDKLHLKEKRLYTFQGCISPHHDLNWVIISRKRE